MADMTFQQVVTRSGNNHDFPSGLKLLRPYACSGMSISTLNIPNDIQYVPKNAFSNLPYLRNITGLDHIKYIGDNGFAGLGSSVSSPTLDITIMNSCEVCNSAFAAAKIRSIVFGENSVLGESVLSTANVISVTFGNDCVAGTNVCTGCSTLTTLISNLKVIPQTGFSQCGALTSVTLTNTRDILTQAFYNCRSLTSINIPATIDFIANNAFQGCTNLTTITIDKPQDSISGAPWGAPSTTQIVWTG